MPFILIFYFSNDDHFSRLALIKRLDILNKGENTGIQQQYVRQDMALVHMLIEGKVTNSS